MKCSTIVLPWSIYFVFVFVFCICTYSILLLTQWIETMATSASVTNDLTTCPICLNLFDVSKSLPCLHAFCLKCLQDYSKDKNPGDEVLCPTCRKEFKIPSDGLGALQDEQLIIPWLKVLFKWCPTLILSLPGWDHKWLVLLAEEAEARLRLLRWRPRKTYREVEKWHVSRPFFVLYFQDQSGEVGSRLELQILK